jgi:hypothetical protein
MIEPISYILAPSAFGPIGIAWREVDQEAKVWHVFLSDGAARAEDRLAGIWYRIFVAVQELVDATAASWGSGDGSRDQLSRARPPAARTGGAGEPRDPPVNQAF